MSFLSLLLILAHYNFGWLPFLSSFVKTRRQDQADIEDAPAKKGQPTRESPTFHRITPFRQHRRNRRQAPQENQVPRRSGPPSAMTITEISDYPFSTSDYYANVPSIGRTRRSGSRGGTATSTVPSTDLPSLHSVRTLDVYSLKI